MHFEFGVRIQLVVLPHSSAQFGHYTNGFCNPHDDFLVKRQVAGDGGGQVGKVVSDLEFFIITGF